MCQGLRERHTKCVCERSMQERERERESEKGIQTTFYRPFERQIKKNIF